VSLTSREADGFLAFLIEAQDAVGGVVNEDETLPGYFLGKGLMNRLVDDLPRGSDFERGRK